ncbi:MAG: NAD(+)/NADH kinase [Planctomycetota bacterium]
MSRRVLLVVNRRKPGADEAARATAAHIDAQGSLIGVVDSNDAYEPPAAGAVDLIAVLGGDGTLLATAQRCLASAAPLAGFNLGRVGYMAAFELAGIAERAPELFGDRPLRERELPLIRGEVNGGEPLVALNEVVVTAGPPYRMISLCLSFDGVPGPTVDGDGLILATPTGSTAYNASAGGAIVSPDVDAFSLTPIAAHSLSFRPIVVPSRTRVEVVVRSANSLDCDGTSLVADGQVRARLVEGDRVVLTRDARSVRFVVDPRTAYWTTLRTKMRWADPPAGR